MKTWLLVRLKEPSTWRGIVWLATVLGLSLRPDQAEAIAVAGATLVGVLGVFCADSNPSLPPVERVGRATDPALADRASAVPRDAGVGPGDQRAADRLRVPPDHRRTGPVGALDANPCDAPVGFGDRD